MRKVFLYGIGGARDSYRVIRYVCLDNFELSIALILHYADLMREYNPSIRAVYAIDNRCGLKIEAQTALKHPTIENCVIFKDTLEREGLRIL